MCMPMRKRIDILASEVSSMMKISSWSSKKTLAYWECFLTAYNLDIKRQIEIPDDSFDYKDSFLSHAKV